MALFQRTRILANQRLDLPDYNHIEDFVCADFKAIHKTIWTNQNFVFSGLASTGVGTNTLSIALAGASFIVGQDDGVMYIGAFSLSPETTTNLSPGTTNYIELSVNQDTGGADSRAFWDPTAAGGVGAEFSQIVDTFIFLKAELGISTSNFSGDPDKVKVCEVDVNGSGVITAIRDRRDLFFRLGRGTNVNFTFPWASRTEPANTQFTGADKDLKNIKQWMDAIMDSVREMKGTTYWYEAAPVTLTGSFRSTGLSVLVGANSSARFFWTGSNLAITDDAGSPLDSDVLGFIRLFDSAANLRLTRQQGLNAIPIADGQVLWVEVPNPLVTTTYDAVGLTSSNYRVTARGSVPLNENVYWLAFREGNRLYLRGLGEMDPGEAKEINDETTESLSQFLGFDPETATSVPYTHFPNGDLPYNFGTSNTLVQAISANCGNINYLDDIINGNPYDEPMYIIAGAPSNDNEYMGPVSPGANIALPLDSRDSNSTEYYVVGKGQLEVYLNGDYLTTGDDWLEVGAPTSLSNLIQINIDLEVGDRLTFRHALVGGLVTIGGGGPVSLQDAYNNGSVITIAPGVPMTLNGTGKIAVFNGDITVTGVIDPMGISFDPQAANPLGALYGIWVENVNGDLIYSRPSLPDINLSANADGSGAAGRIAPKVKNQTGSTLIKLTPVIINSLGYLDAVDVSVEASALAVVGLVDANIPDASAGNIVAHGVLLNITTSASYGDVLYVSKTGSVTNSKPSIGVAGFIEGDFVVRLGVIARNATTPAQKDLLVNIAIVGQL